jgi:autotransporter-associated beta strand protein
MLIRFVVRGAAAVAAFSLLLAALHTRATIYEWKYSGGNVVQSTTPCPDGVGVNAAPSANLAGLDLTLAYMIGNNLTGANLSSGTLANFNASNGTFTSANLSEAVLTSGTLTGAKMMSANLFEATLSSGWLVSVNLTGSTLSSADFSNANLTAGTLVNANLTGAVLQSCLVTGANFSGATLTGAVLSYSNISKTQFYSTGSYQAMSLHGITFSNNNLNAWNFAGQDLTNSLMSTVNLASGTLSNANLTNVDLSSSTLTNANLAGATITGADFSYTNLMSSQFYSTASYQNGNLRGISLRGDDLTGWNLTGKNLSNADLSSGTLTNANFSGATVTGVNFGSTTLTSSQLYSTASYQAQNLQRIVLDFNDLTGWNFANQDLTNASMRSAILAGGTLTAANLTNASLNGADLTNVKMTGAAIVGADFGSTILTSSQLYSTASYQAHTLQGIGLSDDNLTGWNFGGQDLSNANFSTAGLTNANLRFANLQNADFSAATVTGADFSAADTRGAINFSSTDATTTNTILPDGTIQGLNLSGSNSLLTVRNFTGFQTIPVHVTTGMTVAAGGTLQIVMDSLTTGVPGLNWGSTMSFDSGIPVTLGGVLDLYAPGADPAALLGQSIQLFDWTGVAPTGQFSQITSHLPGRYTWDTSGLYTSGTIDLALSTTAAPIVGVWVNGGGGNWSSPANWSGGYIPGAPQDTAIFASASTPGTATVSLDMSVSLAGLTFSPTGGASYLISPVSTSGLTLSNTAGPATLVSSSGTNTIDVPITLQSNLSVSASSGSILTISGNIEESGGSRSLTFGGGGKLILSGVNSNRGGTIVSNGTLIVTSPDGLADGTDLTVGNFSAPTTVAGQWANNGGGNWSTSANWLGGNVPYTGHDTAALGAVLTSGSAAITLSAPVSLAGLSFSPSSGASYVISSTSSNGLTLWNSAGAATLGDSGANDIAAPVTLRSNLSVSVSAGSVLTIAGAIAESGGHESLTLTGGGKLILAGTNTYSGGTAVSGSTLIVTSVNGLAGGSNLTVGNSGSFAPDGAVTSSAVTPVPEPGTVLLLLASAILWRAKARLRFS